jgi:hypothetical protein
MSNFRISFSWIGAIVFLLPMIINVIYAIFPPVNAAEPAKVNKILEIIENATRILYLFALVLLVSKQKLDYKSPWLYIALVFLVLYYIVWIRYFAGGRENSLMNQSFLFIPMPLAIFPVLYFIFAAIWMHNYIAVGIMVVFGVAHNIITYQSFH